MKNEGGKGRKAGEWEIVGCFGRIEAIIGRRARDSRMHWGNRSQRVHDFPGIDSGPRQNVLPPLTQRLGLQKDVPIRRQAYNTSRSNRSGLLDTTSRVIVYESVVHIVYAEL